MDLKKKVKITNAKQFEKMVELLEQNPNLARGHSCGLNKINVKEEWNKIAAKINILGPTVRTGEGWMKVWADFKFKIKKKLIYNKAECRATGGGAFKQFSLSPTEVAASNLLQMHSLVNEGGPAFGVHQTNSLPDSFEENLSIMEDFSIIEDIENEDPCAQKSASKIAAEGNNLLEEPRPSVSTKKAKQPTLKNDLLEEQLKVQTALYTDVKQSLSEIDRYQRKNYKVKEEKLKLYKDELKRQQQYRKEKLDLRKQEIEIERRRVELEEIRNSI